MPCLDADIQSLQHRLVGNVSKIDGAELHVAGDLGDLDLARAFIDLVRAVHDLKNAFRSRKRGQDTRILIGDHVDRSRKFLGILKHCLNTANADAALARDHHPTAYCGDQNVLQVSDKVHDRSHDRAPHTRADRAGAKPLGDLAEFFDRLAFLTVSDYGLVGRDGLLDLSVELSEQSLTAHEIFAHELGKPRRYRNRKRNGDRRDQRHDRAVIKHHGKRTHQGQHTGDQRGDRLRDRVGDVFYIVGHARHDVAVSVCIGIANGKARDLTEQIVSHRAHRALREPCRQNALKIG